MFDTMTITKAFGALCGALLFLLLGAWASESLFNIDTHGERAYVIIEEGAHDDMPDEPVIEVAFADVYAVADAGAGERLFRQCQACHSLHPGQNGVGPSLHGVVDRPKHAADGFGYSDALLATSGAWDAETLSAFIENPRSYAPGTAMAYNGMSDVEDRANLIAFLATQVD